MSKYLATCGFSFLDNNPHAGAAQPKILNAINKDTFDYAGGAGGYIDKYCFPFVRGRLFNTLEKDSNQYENANGYEGTMYTGKAPQTSKDVFRSQAELVEAMSDRRYDRDPAYRQDVIEKLERSDNLSF